MELHPNTLLLGVRSMRKALTFTSATALGAIATLALPVTSIIGTVYHY